MQEAGGKHSATEIQEILALQENRCIYCNALFTGELRPTRDHLLPVNYGGGDWSLNIVLACRRCNSRRGTIPFRTYCKLLSPAQNRRILKAMAKRTAAIDFDRLSDEAFGSFFLGISHHEPRHGRYLDILSMSALARRNAATNTLLPRTPALFLKKANPFLS